MKKLSLLAFTSTLLTCGMVAYADTPMEEYVAACVAQTGNTPQCQCEANAMQATLGAQAFAMLASIKATGDREAEADFLGSLLESNPALEQSVANAHAQCHPVNN